MTPPAMRAYLLIARMHDGSVLSQRAIFSNDWDALDLALTVFGCAKRVIVRREAAQ